MPRAVETNREETRLRLQADLDATKTQAERNRLGQFSTPPRLAAEIVDAALAFLPRRMGIRFLEPGFGTGAFYSAIVEKLTPGRLDAASGFEIDPHYGKQSEKLWAKTPLKLKIADFTRAAPPADENSRFNLIVCNPPYVRHHHLSQTQKAELRSAMLDRCSFEMDGLSGLYCYFLALSTAWMTKDGIGAWLIPSEFMDVNYGARLKQFLLDRVTLLRVHRFDPAEVQFDDALVSSAVVLFQNARGAGRRAPVFSFGAGVLSPNVSDCVSRDELRDISKWTALPQTKRLESSRKNVRTIADLFSIKRGVATGCNSFFVMPPEKADGLRLPRQFLTPILPSPRYLDSSEVLADRMGNPRIARRLLLLSCNLPENQIDDDHPTLAAYLRSGVAAGIKDRYLCAHRDPWYSQEKRPAAPFLCTYMGRRNGRRESPFSFILNRSRATAANVYLMLYPKPWLAALLKQHPECGMEIWKGLSSVTTDMLTSEGRVYGGGLYKIEPRELARIPAEFVLRFTTHKGDWLGQKVLFS